MTRRHGGPHDRGGADFWYHRPRDPHMYEGGSYVSPRIDLTDPESEEYQEYMAGYDEAERDGAQKDWG